MLKEIESESFVCNGKPRGAISFKMGLNAVLGGNSISNSIGKTTFLKVIDFAFGGDNYNSMVSLIGSHQIKFTHTFDKDYRFIRCPDTPDVVSICKEDCYEVVEDITVDDFRRFLLEKYNISDTGLSFDEITKPYVRLSQKKCNTDYILSNGNSINKTEEISILERLFKKFDLISSVYDEIQKVQEEKKEYVCNQHANMQLCVTISAELHKKNETEIASLKNKLKEFTKDKNYEMTQQHLDEGKAVAEINEQISMLSNDRKQYLSHIAKIDSSFSKSELSENDFAELRRYFNGEECNYQALKDVQVFHNTIERILSKELEEEKERLRLLVQAVDERIIVLENKKAEINLPSMIPVEDFITYSKIQERISLLESQNKNADVLDEYQARLATERKKYNQVQVDILSSIQSLINSEISSIFAAIAGKDCTAPVFEVNENLLYQYGIASNLGDGDNNKSVIAFDLSILHLTVLPYVIHDSRLFSGVDRNHVSNIIKQYSDVTDKQIFISIDDIDSYSDEVKEIIRKSRSIELGSGSNALYGRRLS